MSNQTLRFLRETLFKNLEEGTVKLPDGYDPQSKKLTGELIDVPIKDLGISRVWLVQDKALRDDVIDPDAQLLAEGGTGAGFAQSMGLETAETQAAAAAEAAAPVDPMARLIKVKRYDFVVQFCWQPKTRTQRRVIAEARAQAAEEAAATAAEEVAMGADAAAQ
jgi:type IV pilus assembly protein PilM